MVQIRKAWCATCSKELEWVADIVDASGEPNSDSGVWACNDCEHTFTDDQVKKSNAFVSPWIPMDQPIDIKHIGKAIEELCECGAAIARCLIQGIDECDPGTGKLNRNWLQDEIADVLANMRLIVEHFGLDKDMIAARRDQKLTRLRAWHGMLAIKDTASVDAAVDLLASGTREALGEMRQAVYAYGGKLVKDQPADPTKVSKRNATKKRTQRKGVKSG